MFIYFIIIKPMISLLTYMYSKLNYLIIINLSNFGPSFASDIQPDFIYCLKDNLNYRNIYFKMQDIWDLAQSSVLIIRQF